MQAGSLESLQGDGIANIDDKKITLSSGVRIKKYIHKTIHIHIYNFGTIVQAKYICQNFQLCATRVIAMSPTQNKAIVNGTSPHFPRKSQGRFFALSE